VLDALFVVVLFHEHLFAPGTSLNHDLTAPSLAIGFMLLTHVALRLRPRLVLLFSGIVVAGWLSLLFVAVEAHLGMASAETIDWSAFLTEGALAAAFGFAAAVCCLLVHDHNVQLARAVMTERRRANLSRFFSPAVLGELEVTGASLLLGRRRAAVMFVDLRSFTRLSETMPLEEMADLLAEFRELVTREVFAHGGMIDKFIGDGVMAAFSQRQALSGDVTRALDCAIHLGGALARWKEVREHSGRAAPDAGIGLHVGMVISGVLRSGSHDEFTLLGDTVNVAERLERLTKTLDACVVVSEAAIVEARGLRADGWDWSHDVELEGRAGRLNVAYLPRRADPDPEKDCPRGGGA
jgi:adenylate cyclase